MSHYMSLQMSCTVAGGASTNKKFILGSFSTPNYHQNTQIKARCCSMLD